jgi:hypothetical protein
LNRIPFPAPHFGSIVSPATAIPAPSGPNDADFQRRGLMVGGYLAAIEAEARKRIAGALADTAIRKAASA